MCSVLRTSDNENTLWWTWRESNPRPECLQLEGITTILYLRFFLRTRLAVAAIERLCVAFHLAMITYAYEVDGVLPLVLESLLYLIYVPYQSPLLILVFKHLFKLLSTDQLGFLQKFLLERSSLLYSILFYLIRFPKQSVEPRMGTLPAYCFLDEYGKFGCYKC